MRAEFPFIFGIAMSAMALSTPPADAKSRRPITVDDLFRFERLSDPQISPEGSLVTYIVTTADPKENKTHSTIWLVDTKGGAPRRLTNSTAKDKHPRFSPDGRRIVFESNRSGENQLWIIDVDGGEARQLTTLASEASNAIWSPDGKWIAFVSAVYPDLSHKPFAESDAATKARKEEKEKSKVKAKVFTRLFFRHWDSYVEDKRQHLFVVPAEGGAPRDLTPGDFDAYPTSTTFSVGDDFTFTPDSQALVYTGVPRENEAWNTNHDLYLVRLAGGEPVNLTESNPAADGAPSFSPDGRHLAWRAQTKPGYEADKWDIVIAGPDGKNPRRLTMAHDLSIESFDWAADSKSVWFIAEENGGAVLFQIDAAAGALRKTLEGGTASSLSVARSGNQLAVLRSTMTAPPDVWLVPAAGGPARNLTRANRALLEELELSKPESVKVPVEDGAMQMWVVRPPGFDEGKKWPLLYLVHGGPQGAWQDAWNFRWNAEVFAAAGYVVALPNPRGSTGFGQKFVDAISADWGGKCYRDLMAGVSWLEQKPFIDTDRMAAAGASFGGYMMNWFQGNTRKFKTLVCHCGVFNFDSMYSTTEELWFDEWEHGGPPWGKRDSYEKHSPHRFAGQFKTPMLIIHNDLDFRVPVSEGIQLFTTLQRLGIRSKLINFPDEGHWVLKPANSRFWYNEILKWVAEFVPPGPRPGRSDH